jgi:drug/metabolite transporter (DMT)-like permease
VLGRALPIAVTRTSAADYRARPLNSAYLLAALGSVCYGSADLCGGIAARRGPPLSVTFVSAIGALAVLLLGVAFLPGHPSPADLTWAAGAGACGAWGALLIYRALAIGPVSVASPVLCVVGLAIPVLVGIGLGERPSPFAIAGLVIAPLAIVLLAQSDDGPAPEDRGRARRVLGPAIAAGLVAGTFLVMFGQIRSGAGLLPILLARVVGLAVLAVAVLAVRAPMPPRASRGLAFVAGIVDSLANVLYVFAVQRGTLSLVAAIVSLAPATTVLLARVLLGERWSPPQRAGLVAALVSGALISIG